jgi:hypothetical protein
VVRMPPQLPHLRTSVVRVRRVEEREKHLRDFWRPLVPTHRAADVAWK